MATLVIKVTPLSPCSIEDPQENAPISLTALGHEDHLDPLNLSKKAALTKYIESHDYQHSIDHQL
jgi:hypothetical protein